MPLHVAGPLSSLGRSGMAPSAEPEAVVDVPIRTLKDILEEAGAPRGFDFLSIDVEGHEIEVLRGIDLRRWRPHLIMIEDHVPNLSRHRYLNSRQLPHRQTLREQRLVRAGRSGRCSCRRSANSAQILFGAAVSHFSRRLRGKITNE